MAISYRATPVYGLGTTVTKQSGTRTGDWIFIYISTDSGPPNPASCSGFSAVSVQSGSGADGTLLYRYADGTEGSSFTFTIGAGNPAYVIATLTGASATLDPSSIAVPNSPAGGTSIPVNGITLTKSNDWVLWFAGANYSPASPPSISAPSGFTVDSLPASGQPICRVAHSTAFSVGSTGVQTGSLNETAWSSGVMVALTPSSSSGLLMANYI